MKFALILMAALLGTPGMAANPAPAERTPLPPVSVDGFSFSHPMTVINPAEMAEVKRRIAARVEPQISALVLLIRDADAVQNFRAAPPPTLYIMGGYGPDGAELTRTVRPLLWRSDHAAYASALAYAYTGKTAYADTAVGVLNAWAARGTTFTGVDSGLELGSYFSGMLYAADLLHDYAGWKSGDRERFNSWWRKNCLPCLLEIMRLRDNNWKDAAILGVLCSAVVLEDKSALAEALGELQSYFSDRRDDRVKIKGAWKFQKDARGVYLPREVTRNDGRSGITYTSYAFTSMVEAFEIAGYAGHDFWPRRTPEGVGLQDAIEQLFRWEMLEQPFPWNAHPGRNTTRKNVYEIANNHFRLSPEIGRWLEKNRPVNGEQGDEYVTLNHGNLSLAQ